MLNLPEPDDLDTAVARGAVRERIAAAESVLKMAAECRKLVRLHQLGDKYTDYNLQDVESEIEGQRDKLQEVLAIAMSFSDRTAPRRPTMDMLERIT